MIAVFKHEVSSYFSNLSGYVFGTFILLFAGVYTMAFNISGLSTYFEYVIGSMAFIFLIIVPVLTMRVIAEERKQKTDQLLYSLPISMAKVVIGKYLALLVMFLVPTAIISLYPLILNKFGVMHFPASYSAIVGFFLLGATLISIGVFISSLTDNQAVAAGICFVVMLLLYFVSSLADYMAATARGSFIAFTIVILVIMVIVWFMTKSALTMFTIGLVLEAVLTGLFMTNGSKFEGLFPKILDKISIFDRFYSFVDGVFDITAVVYYVSIITVFLFLTVESLEKRRWS